MTSPPVALAAFVAGCERIYSDYLDLHFASLPKASFVVKHNPKGLSDIVRRQPAGDWIHCQIDLQTGWVFRPLHSTACTNIYEPDFGLSKMGPFGPKTSKHD